jgi:hypothetical protein
MYSRKYDIISLSLVSWQNCDWTWQEIAFRLIFLLESTNETLETY